MKILMVCLGNICRSPLAEGIMKAKLPADFVVDSAGTSGFHSGDAPDPRSIAVAQKYGIDISNQRSRQISVQDFEEFDKIYCMDKSNLKNVLALAENDEQRQKVALLLTEADRESIFTEVPDPYYGGAKGFEKVFEMIDIACEEIAKKIVK